MFERFTDRARRVVVQAQVEAKELRHNYIGTEHLLLGLIDIEEGLAVRVLRSLNVDPEAVADQVRDQVGHGEQPIAEARHIPFTPTAKETLELALREALQLKHTYIGTEHLLLGILSQGEGAAAEVLIANGVHLETARTQVSMLLREHAMSMSARPVRVAGLPWSEVSAQLRMIGRRLAAIEARLGIEPSAAEKRVRQLDAAITRVRREKTAAMDAHDMEAAARNREQERDLIIERNEAQIAWFEEFGGEEPPLL
jgi:hypothetical protein